MLLSFSRRILCVVIFSFLLCNVSAVLPVAHAEMSLVMDDLLTRGKDLYQKNDYKAAIECFAKVITIEADNAEAIEYLKKMGADPQLYDKRYRPRALGTNEIATFERKIDKLEKARENQAKTEDTLYEEQEFLRQRLEAKKEKEEALLQEVDSVKDQAAEELSEKQAVIAAREKDIAQKTEEAAQLDHTLKHAQNDLEEKNAALAVRDEQLRDLELKIGNLELTSQRDRVAYQNDVADIEFKLAKYKEASSYNTREQSARLESLQGQLRKKIVELGYLNDKMVMSNYKAGSSGNEVALKNRQITELKSSLKELEKDLNYYQTRVKALEGKKLVAKDPKFPEGYSDKLELLKKQDAVIGQLKEKLAKTKKQAAELQRGWGDGKVDEVQLKGIQNEMATLKAQLGEKEEALKEKEENYNVISSQLKETQKQLTDVQAATQGQDSLKDAEKRLDDILKQ